MRRLVETDEVSGFDAMIGERICVFCNVYIYTGILSGVNDDHIELSDPKIVYETGPLMEGDWKDAQSALTPLHVMRGHIESWGRSKC